MRGDSQADRSPERGERLPSLAVAVSGVLWGLFWLPLREAGAAGLRGGWPSLAIYLLATLLLLPGAWRRRGRLRAAGSGLLLTGAIAGSAFSLYATALLLTEVVRVLLLFYLTPVWGTLLARLLLGERITPGRAVALGLGIVGLIAILGVEGGYPLPRNAGDWLALAAGVAWAYGSLGIYSNREVGNLETVFAFFAGGLAVTVVTVWLPVPGNEAPPSAAALLAALPWVALLVGVFAVPPVIATLWGAARLTPGRVGILLMGEVVVGIVTAAAWSGEPFGPREALGAVLVVAAGVIEVLQRRAPPAGGA